MTFNSLKDIENAPAGTILSEETLSHVYHKTPTGGPRGKVGRLLAVLNSKPHIIPPRWQSALDMFKVDAEGWRRKVQNMMAHSKSTDFSKSKQVTNNQATHDFKVLVN